MIFLISLLIQIELGEGLTHYQVQEYSRFFLAGCFVRGQGWEWEIGLIGTWMKIAGVRVITNQSPSLNLQIRPHPQVF